MIKCLRNLKCGTIFENTFKRCFYITISVCQTNSMWKQKVTPNLFEACSVAGLVLGKCDSLKYFVP